MRKAEIKRKTRETDIKLKLNLDGTGKSRIDIPSGFFSHMLELFSRHSMIDLDVKGRGDIEVDLHHLVEDTGICLGQALDRALAKRERIERYGWALVPMDEAATLCSLDLSNRPLLKYRVRVKCGRINDFDTELVKEFFKAVSDNARMTLHIINQYGSNSHHIVESVFKAFSKALRQAVRADKSIKGVMSTKNVI